MSKVQNTIIFFFTLGILSAFLLLSATSYNKHLYTIKSVKDLKHKLISDGKYKCCLSKPCSECLLDALHIKEKLQCDCLIEIINGESPCGECTGEILKGEGNPLIAEYFANALYKDLGIEKKVLQELVSLKYNLSISKQI